MPGRGSSSATGGGYTYEDYARVLTRWSTDMDRITTEDRKILESFIKDEVRNVGPVKSAYGISRGISMSDAELDKLQVGSEFKEGKLASWSSKVGIAQSFARENTSESKPNKVVIRTKEPSKQAAKIGRIVSTKKFGEAEALMSSKAKFEIVKVKIDRKNYSEIWVKPKN